jgi:hypothetical protein
MRKISAQTNNYADTKKTYRERGERDRKPDENTRITSVTGRGYEKTMRTYYHYAEAERIRERDKEQDRDRDHKRYQK